VSTGHKHKKKHTRFTFQSLIRLTLFSIIVFFIISFISGQKTNSLQTIDPVLSVDEQKPNFILGKTTEISNNIYQSIPENSRKQLENLNQNPTTTLIQEKINLIKEQSQGFPQTQIKEIQKMIINNIYQNTLRSIDSQ